MQSKKWILQWVKTLLWNWSLVDRNALAPQFVSLPHTCLQPCLGHISVQNFNVLLRPGFWSQKLVWFLLVGWFVWFKPKHFKSVLWHCLLVTAVLCSTIPRLRLPPSPSELTWGQTCLWIEHCRIRPYSKPKAGVWRCQFPHLRHALKDNSGFIQFTFNLQSSIYTMAICKHVLCVCV